MRTYSAVRSCMGIARYQMISHVDERARSALGFWPSSASARSRRSAGGPPEDMDAFLAATFDAGDPGGELATARAVPDRRARSGGGRVRQVEEGPRRRTSRGASAEVGAPLRPPVADRNGRRRRAAGPLPRARACGRARRRSGSRSYDQNAHAIAFYERWGFTEVGELYFTFGSEPPPQCRARPGYRV